MTLEKLLKYVFTWQRIELWDVNNAHETIIRVEDKSQIPTKYLKCKIEESNLICNEEHYIVISIITK